MREELARWLQKHTHFAGNLEWDQFDEDEQEGFRCEADQLLALIKEKIEKSLLTDEEIGDSLGLDTEYEFPRSDGSVTSTIDCRPVARAQLDKVRKALEG